MRLMTLHYADKSTAEVADMLGRGINQVYLQALHMGLKKAVRRGALGRYLGGSVPHNKGKKMKPEVYAKVKNTMFQKGSSPHNTKYDGHERVTKDGYVEVRIRKGKYRLKHLHLWEQKNGKLPGGHCLRAVDGNRQHTDPENWELTSQADNMRKNSIHHYPPEVVEVIRLQGKLNRTIKQIADEKQD